MDDPSTPSPSTQPYTTAILLATFSLLSALLIMPPMLWHFSNRNIGATSLILWLLLLNFQSALNALLWPHDDLSAHFNGTGLCDIEVKLQIAASVGVPSSVASILRALARVMNTEKASLGLSKGEKRRGYVIDLVWCVGCPVLQMFFHYVVQTERYYVVGIAGCTPAVSNSWVTDLLIFAPPVGWTVFGGFYSGEFGCFSFMSLVEGSCWLTWLLLRQFSFSSACTATAATSPACWPTATPTGPASCASSPSASSGSPSPFLWKSTSSARSPP